jgi:hypothetical protein
MSKTSCHTIVGLGVLVVMGISTVTAAEEISYSATVVDNGGISRAFAFQGSSRGSTLEGTLTVDGSSIIVAGNVSKNGSLTGELSGLDGSVIGRFWGQRVGNQLKGSFDLGGRVGDWDAPANRLPIPK